MKLTIFLTIIGTLGISAATSYSQETKLTLSLENVKIKDLLKEIKNKSDFSFWYSNIELDDSRRVTLDVKNQTVDKILELALKDENVTFEIKDKFILIYKSNDKNLNRGVSVLQQQKISGIITDATTKEPLVGVNVVIEGTTIGVISDVDGKFNIEVSNPNAILIASFIGYNTERVAVTGQSSLVISLIPDITKLDEIVVIGYGTTTKRKMVGAISTIDSKKFEQLPVSNVSQALQGRIPGLIVQANGGQPGSSPTLSIRGASSPLFVIDGVELDAEDDVTFATLNPEDIETLSFLKDAASTAVYGSRAANGIVLITTKHGEDGKLRLKYSINYQLATPAFLPKRMNTYDYSLIQNQADLFDGNSPSFNADQLDIIKNHKDLLTYPDNNWIDLLTRKYSPETRHNISLSDGNKQTNYFISLGYYNQEGIYKSNASNAERFNLRANVKTNFEKIGLTVGVNVNASLQTTRKPGAAEILSGGVGDPWYFVNNAQPITRAYNPDGTIAAGVEHPVAETDINAGYFSPRKKFINTQLVVDWKVPGVKGLKAGFMANYRDMDSYTRWWKTLPPQYNSDSTIFPVSKPKMEVNSSFSKKMDIVSKLSYLNSFGKHTIDATLVYTQTVGNGDYVSAVRREYNSSAVDQLFSGPSEGKDNYGIAYQSAMQGYVARLKYDFSSKYIFEVSGRYDGNDNFAPNKRWGFFPSVSGAWVITDEEFMKPLKSSNILTMFKLRASTGTTGSSDGVNRFGYLSNYNLDPSVYNINNKAVTGFTEGNLTDPNSLTWFTLKSKNIGFDFSSLNNRLNGSFDYFFNRTTGFLMSPKNSYTTPLGKDLPQVTSNTVLRRAGYEISLSYKGTLGDFTYEVGGNLSQFNSLYETLASEDSVTLKNPLTRVTQQTDSWGAALVSEGLYQGKDDILNSQRRLASTETKPGQIRYLDVNGDGKIDEADNKRMGLPVFPHINYGIDLNLTYKGWYLYALVQGTGNRYIYLSGLISSSEPKNQLREFQKNSWTPTNPNAEFPRVSNSASVNGQNNQATSDFWMRNAKYVRLKSLQIGYNLKSTLLKKVSFIESCKLVLSGSNLFTISDVTKYFDPELIDYSGSLYPMTKVYSVGLTVQF